MVIVYWYSSVSSVGLPVPPARKKRVMSMFPEQMESSAVSAVTVFE